MTLRGIIEIKKKRKKKVQVGIVVPAGLTHRFRDSSFHGNGLFICTTAFRHIKSV